MATEPIIITSFTSGGDFLAVLTPTGSVKVWNTSNGSLLAEWKPSDGNHDNRFSCLACTFLGKKRRKGKGTFLVALGTDDGDVLAINVFTSEMKWKSTGLHPGGISSISFANKGWKLRVVGTNGMASEMNSETGDLIQEFKLSKKLISKSVFACDEKIVAAATAKLRVFSLEDGKELVKLSTDLGSVQHISVSDDAKAIITSGVGEKHLQVWKCELSTGSVSCGPMLSMRRPPLLLECKNSCSGEDGLVVLSVSDSNVAHIWNLKTFSDVDLKPIKITVKANEAENDLCSSARTRKRRDPILAARINALESDGPVKVLMAYGSTDFPQFSVLDIPSSGEDIVIAAGLDALDTDTGAQQNVVPTGRGLDKLEAEAGAVRKARASKKRAASDTETEGTETFVDNGHGDPMDGVQTEDDLNEPTMGEKLAGLNFTDDNKVKSHEQKESSPCTKPPSADSVHVLLKQALHADDRALLLDCLYRKDEKVVANSVSLLNSSDVLKLLQSLIPIIQSRGAVLACALPWLRSLLLQHASGIMSQESSLLALNSLYQIMESRVSNFNPALQLSSSLDLLYSGTIDDDDNDENDLVPPVIFEDKDESDENESEDAMETSEEDSTELKTFSDFSDVEDIDDMSD